MNTRAYRTSVDRRRAIAQLRRFSCDSFTEYWDSIGGAALLFYKRDAQYVAHRASLAVR